MKDGIARTQEAEGEMRRMACRSCRMPIDSAEDGWAMWDHNDLNRGAVLTHRETTCRTKQHDVLASRGGVVEERTFTDYMRAMAAAYGT